MFLLVGGAFWIGKTSAKNGSLENKQPTNSQSQIHQLQTELNSVKNKLNNLSDTTQKTELENKLSRVESQIKNLSENPNQSVIKKLAQEIKEVKQKLENGNKPDKDKNDKPDDNDKPNDKDDSPNPNPQPGNKGFNFVSTKINNDTYKYKITLDVDGSEIDFANFIIFLKTKDKHFFQVFQGALKDANSKFPAYFWKCPPVSLKTISKPFEFVVIKSDSLNNITQNHSKFQEHFGKSRDNQAVSFFSPSGNLLVSPVPKGTADYKNISQFTKNAPDEQQQALWKEVADSLYKELEKEENSPRWLNTEGTGVPYLHVRIDKTSKFYSNYLEWK